MTPNQKIIERNEFGVEDGIESLKILEALAANDMSPEGRMDLAAYQRALEAMETARVALSSTYDTIGWTAKERRRAAE